MPDRKHLRALGRCHQVKVCVLDLNPLPGSAMLLTNLGEAVVNFGAGKPRSIWL